MPTERASIRCLPFIPDFESEANYPGTHILAVARMYMYAIFTIQTALHIQIEFHYSAI